MVIRKKIVRKMIGTGVVTFVFLVLLTLLSSGILISLEGTVDKKGSAAPSADFPLSKSLAVAAVQMRSSNNLQDNVERIKGFIKDCAINDIRVAVFPECALSGYFEDVIINLTAEQINHAEKQVVAACRESSIYAIVGMPFRDGNKLFNSAVVISPDGEIIERYHKVQLAERWPDAGDHLSVFTIDGIRCSIIICHDERYPELVRLPVLAGAQVIFYISHESGILKEHKINPYRAQIQARAVENTVYVVQANAPANEDASGSHGQSRIIAPDGNILQEASIFQEDIITHLLDITKANRGNAMRSLTRGPLREWWTEGIKNVRIVE